MRKLFLHQRMFISGVPYVGDSIKKQTLLRKLYRLKLKDKHMKIAIKREQSSNKFEAMPSESILRDEGAKQFSLKRHSKAGRLKAFSLPELLVVLVIIGILVLIALPNLMPLISKAKSVEAQQQLIFLHSLQKTYFYTYSRYSASLDELGFEQQPLVTNEGNANYLIEITSANENSFTARATAVVDFDQDGIYNVWEIDQNKQLREATKD